MILREKPLQSTKRDTILPSSIEERCVPIFSYDPWLVRMIIRSEQLALIDESMQRQYSEKLRTFLREQSAQLVVRLDDNTLYDWIAAAVRKARIYGVRTDEGMLAYVCLSVAAGPAFHDDPKIRHFLDLPSDDPDVKVCWLFERVLTKLQGLVDVSK